jgi:CheY-like chemotaxis protein
LRTNVYLTNFSKKSDRLFERRSAMARKKALVIDDEQVVLDKVSTILTDENYEVDVSLSGRQGLDWATHKHYDIILTDIRMPDIGGMRVLRDIKMARPSLPVVIISGYATIQSAEHALKLGATDYLEKPFTREQLLNTVASALDISAHKAPGEQRLIHKEEMIKVLDRAGSDNEFIFSLLNYGADALDEYELSGPEKLALLTGDISWIEDQIGHLTPSQKRWLELRKESGIW